MRLAILLAALAAALLLPREATAFEAENAGAPTGTANFADPDETLGLESSDEGGSPADGSSGYNMLGGSLQVYGDVSTPAESSGVLIPGQLP